MRCHCHGKSGVSVTRTSPYDQCTTCAKKHIVKAWSLFREFCYEDDNRDTITGQLRLAVDHLMYFLIQNLVYLETGDFAATKKELGMYASEEDREALSLAELPDEYDFDKAFRCAFQWCRNALYRLDRMI